MSLEWVHLGHAVNMLERRNWNISSEKKSSFQQLGKKKTFGFFYAASSMLFTLFQQLSIFVIIVVLLFTRTIKVADVIYYGYLFHIVFH